MTTQHEREMSASACTHSMPGCYSVTDKCCTRSWVYSTLLQIQDLIFCHITHAGPCLTTSMMWQER